MNAIKFTKLKIQTTNLKEGNFIQNIEDKKNRIQGFEEKEDQKENDKNQETEKEKEKEKENIKKEKEKEKENLKDRNEEIKTLKQKEMDELTDDWFKPCELCSCDCKNSERIEILETKFCNDYSGSCKYCNGFGIKSMLIRNKESNKKTKYLFGIGYQVIYCKKHNKKSFCHNCSNTRIQSVYYEGNFYSLKNYKKAKIINYCYNCQRENCKKCGGYGFQSLVLHSSLTIPFEVQYDEIKNINFQDQSSSEICLKCLGGMNVKVCLLCKGRGEMLKNVTVCNQCNGFGFGFKEISKTNYSYQKLKKCNKCLGNGVPYKSYIDLSIEECKEIGGEIMKLKRFLNEKQWKYQLDINGNDEEFLLANDIFFDHEIPNQNNIQIAIQSLKHSFSGVRLIVDILKREIGEEKLINNPIEQKKLYLITTFSNFPHHLQVKKEEAGFIVTKDILQSIINLLKEVLISFYQNKLIIEDNEEQVEEKFTCLKINNDNNTLVASFAKKVNQNNFQNYSIKNFLQKYKSYQYKKKDSKRK
ncbi:hypothetical protein M0812_08513 [Anaeramoeba flamelloides]|uniref:Uncharacterized protein n=1 Tax=Anaeramoeba flamelloides TaxID=1746091 RepID=A0AAV7ZWQ2_9EUKA|nr:hypothetical protein M0812_08513 [Anaeramoeba flamelloides]